MNEDTLHTWMEPEFEARIIALILGEASDFEKEELENRIAESPEANLFYRRMVNLHALLGTIPLRNAQEDTEWKLSPQRREKLLATIGQPRETTPVRLKGNAAPTAPRRKRHGKRGRWKQVLPIAASIALLGLMATALLSTLPGIQMAATGIKPVNEFAYRESEVAMDKSVAATESDQSFFGIEEGAESTSSLSLDDMTASLEENATNDIDVTRNGGNRGTDSLADRVAPPAGALTGSAPSVSFSRQAQASPTMPRSSLVNAPNAAGNSSERKLREMGDARKEAQTPAIAATQVERDRLERVESESLAIVNGAAHGSADRAFPDTNGVVRELQPQAAPDPFAAPADSSGADSASSADPLGGTAGEPGEMRIASADPFADPAIETAPAAGETFFDSGYDHTRSKMLREVASGWEIPDPSGAAPAEPAAREAGQSLAAADPFAETAQAGGGSGGTLAPGLGGLSRLNAGKKAATQEEPLERERFGKRADLGNRTETMVEQKRLQELNRKVDLPRQEAARETNEEDRGGEGEASDSMATVKRELSEKGQGSDQPVNITAGFIVGQEEELRSYDFQLPALDEKNAEEEPFSTFSLHVGDSSFHLARAALAQSQWPERESIRVEEFVNALDYRDRIPTLEEKVGVALDQARHPFLQQRNLLRISLATAARGRQASIPLRLTLLLDNSGSMERPDRQETVRRAFSLLLAQLQENDEITLISFARQPRLLADRVRGAEAAALADRIATLPSEGGTNLEAALDLAFQKAREQQVPNAQNRIILLTDGAANLGDAEPARLGERIETFREAGIAFDAAGIGARGLNDEILEALTRKGDGRYYLLDRPEDADAGFARQIAGALRPAAGNVKLQVEFNPDRVGAYQLIGFEKHRLEKEDFRNDAVDAAELAAAEAGVAVYQVEAKPDGSGDIGSVSVRFRDLSTGEMVEKRWPILYDPNTPPFEQAAPAIRIAATAAFLGSRLKENALGQTVELEALNRVLNHLPSLWHRDGGVQQLREMLQQTRTLTSE